MALSCSSEYPPDTRGLWDTLFTELQSGREEWQCQDTEIFVKYPDYFLQGPVPGSLLS